ncbi:CLUMA_CG001270, isoform A [Clunio marinus]|uniref:CLUMA_CG001270, isoform A n=1 Tax=Clunio marinus TaxID=568069 RepID=A0A1J1HHI9_9DIPT|nr:CLUMA_CG001270, isoform A [Clunio marinus]
MPFKMMLQRKCACQCQLTHAQSYHSLLTSWTRQTLAASIIYSQILYSVIQTEAESSKGA